jgi:hypothetical protein
MQPDGGGGVSGNGWLTGPRLNDSSTTGGLIMLVLRRLLRQT